MCNEKGRNRPLNLVGDALTYDFLSKAQWTEVGANI